MSKRNLAVFVARIVLVVAIASASASVASVLKPAGQAMACSTSGHSGGGC